LSSSTNDLLRIGARAELLLERIADLSTFASEERFDVRLGISWVVTQKNASELTDLVRFAKRADLYWVKLEELFVREDHVDAVRALALDRYALDVAVAQARALGDELGVRVLDHTRPLTVWRCRFHEDERMKRRALADDLVNRVELNPCRAPWETVCVEPNGDVRPLSFHHPIAGNVLVHDLAVLWNAPAFVDARKAARATRLCGAGPTTCARDPGPSGW
ncbi:MAG TPA: SPASM domain-containing protein, partial [Myxococcota bacterium]